MNKNLFAETPKMFEELELLISNGYYEEAKITIEELIIKKIYINRCNLLLARIFIFEGDYKNAEEKLIILYKKEYNNALVELINLYVTTQEYDKAYYLLDEVNNLKTISESKKDLLNNIVLKGMNLETKPRSKALSYQSRQVIDFNPNDAVAYITTKNKKNNNKDFFVLNSSEEILEIYLLAEHNLEYATPFPETGCFDNYIFKYDNSGINGNNEVSNYVKVTVIKNTNNIISIYPCLVDPKSKIEYIDLRNVNKNLEGNSYIKEYRG